MTHCVWTYLHRLVCGQQLLLDINHLVSDGHPPLVLLLRKLIGPPGSLLIHVLVSIPGANLAGGQ